MDKPLSNKRHERFAHEYSIDLNATRAYQAVYNNKDVTSAAQSGNRLLKNIKVKARYEFLISQKNERADIDALEYIKQLRHDAMFDPATVMHWDGYCLKVKSFDDIPVESRRMIKSIKCREVMREDAEEADHYIEVTFCSREKFSESYGRHVIFRDQGSTFAETIEQFIFNNVPTGKDA